jgi:PAS domain S-box-containing protein
MKSLKRANRSGELAGKRATKSEKSSLPRGVGNQFPKKVTKRKLRSDSNTGKERYKLLFEQSQNAVIVYGPDSRVVASNPMAQRLFGMTPEEMKGKETTDFPWAFLREDGSVMPANEFPVYLALASHEMVSNMVVGIKRTDRREILWTIASAYCVRDSQRKPAEIVVSHMDVTGRKQADHVQQRLNRELHAITNCNEVLLRATDEYALLHDICRVVCEEAGYRMAWVGYAEHDEGKTVRPVAWAGYEEGYLADARISWADVKRGRGPSGTAIRDGKSHGIQDFATDPCAEPWRVEALRRGYQSSIASPLKDEHGNTFGVLTIYSQETNAFTPDEIRLIEELAGDLAFGITTLRTRVERTLAQKEIALLSFAMNSVHETAYLIDEDGRFSLVNDESCRMLGFSREELLHMSVPDIDPDYPADRWSTHWDQLKKGGSFRWEGHHRTSGGTLVPVEINANYFEYNGKAYSFALVRDITERKHAEKALRESEKKFRSFVESSSEGFTLVDEQGAIIEWNSAREKMTGLAASQVLGQKLWDVQYQLILPTLQTPEFYSRFKQTLLDALATGKSPIFDQTLEVEILQREHPPRYIRQTVFPIRTEKGFRIGSVTSDITERRRAEEEIHKLNQELELRVAQRTTQLEAANKELEAFAYSVSHDLRAPLRAIDGFSQILIEGTYEGLDATARGYLDRVRGGAQRMAQLIDDLLSLSRVSRTEMVIQSVDLSQVARRVADELRGLDPLRDVKFEIQSGVTAAGDDRLLRIVLENLLGNAWKYTSKHQAARIEFGMLRQDEKPVYFVRDDGSGFDMQYRDKLFGAFQRLHTTTDFPGTGIGLATVQRIVHRHGGKVWALGEVEKGATFFFTIA